MRALALIGIGLLVGFAGGFLLGLRLGDAPEAGPGRDLAAPDDSRPAGAGRGRDLEPELEGPRAETRYRPGVPAVGGALLPGPRSALVALAYEDRDGRSLGEGLGVAIGSSAGGARVLVPLRDLRGAAFASARIDGRACSVRSLVGIREDLGLALIDIDTAAPTFLPAADPAGPGEVLVAIDLAGVRRPLEILRRVFDSSLLAEVFECVAGQLPDRPTLVLDDEGRIQGLGLDLEDRRVALVVAGFDPTSIVQLDIALSEYDRIYFAGSAADFVARARTAFKEQRYADSVGAWHRVFELEPFRMAELLAELERSWRALLARGSTDPLERLALLRRALVDLPEAGDFWLELGGLLRARGNQDEAIVAYTEAARLAPELVPDLLALSREIRYEQALALVTSGRIDEARSLLFASLAQLGGHVDLWLLHADLAQRRRDYAVAADAWRAALGLDPGLATELDPAIARAESLMEGPGRFVIDYDPRQRSITVQVGINDRATGEFVIDTGATVSMVPDALARAAGLDVSERAPKVRLDTAGSSRIVPFTPAGSIQVGPLRLEGLSVVVGNLSGDRSMGLLGMDFLQNFHLVNDTSNGRLVLSER